MIKNAKEKDINAVAELFYQLHGHHIDLFSEFYRSADISFFRGAVKKCLRRTVKILS